MKYCPKCKETKSFDLFNKNKRTKSGLQAYCILCRSIEQKEYRNKNKDKTNKLAKKHREKNRSSFLNALKKYRESEKGKARKTALQQKRKANQLNRTPKWLSADDNWILQEVYELATLRTKLTGIDWHVDHVVPMQGTNVSGLHCPENLQVIPAKHNVRKNNKWCWKSQT